MTDIASIKAELLDAIAAAPLDLTPILADLRNETGADDDESRPPIKEACALVREYKGAFSGEHGDGLVRSEWIEPILGARLVAALGEI